MSSLIKILQAVQGTLGGIASIYTGQPLIAVASLVIGGILHYFDADVVTPAAVKRGDK